MRAEEIKAAPAPPPAAEAKPETRTNSGPVIVTRRFHAEVGGISVNGVVFDERNHRLFVADQPGGPGSQWADARAAANAFGGVAAVNAGFFTPEGSPLGLVVSGSKRAGALNRSSLGAGFVIGGSSPALVRKDRWSSAADAVQSGPFLLEHGQSVGGLSESRSTARIFIATDGIGHWVLARTGPCSLAELSRALAGADLGGVTPVTTLNLDGGRSSDLWISGSVTGGPLHERPLWNKPVRNFLILAPR